MRSWAKRFTSFLAFVLLLAGGLPAGAAQNTAPAASDAPRMILLGAGFDTRSGDGVAEAERANPPAGAGPYLVQFQGPVQQAWVDAIKATGATVYDYVPNYALLVRMTPAQGRAVAALQGVAWTGYYQPTYKLAPDLPAEGGEAVVAYFPWAAADAKALAATGATVQEAAGAGARVKADRQALAQIARLDTVAYIAPWVEPTVANAAARTVIKADVVQGKNVTGLNQIVAVTDTGIYKAHEAFSQSAKIAGVIDVAGDGASSGGDGFGHGTHVAGSVAGDAPAFGTWNGYDGQGFAARLVDVKVFNNQGVWAGGTDYYAFWNQPYGLGARINQNSWGSNSGGAYGNADREADRVAWDHRDYLFAIAAGNAGSGTNTVGSPAGSKNAITVGATLTATPEDMASFSSRGPTDDGRIKPDVVAPGSMIHSAQRGTTSGYVDMQGTSMATPQVSGAAALVRQYFQSGFYPSGTPNAPDARNPSAALVKAVLINGAQEITGAGSDLQGEGKWPNNSQGWGRINLDRSLYFAGDTRSMTLYDEPSAPTTGAAWSRTYAVPDGNRSLKFTLTWTDPPAASGATVALVNDLHLRVTAPDGTVFLGNNFTGRNPGYSVSGGAPDSRNTVEGVHLVPGKSFAGNLPTGTYTVEVLGANVPTPGSNFAVVIGSEPYGNSQPPAGTDVAIMGDYSDQLGGYLRSQGLTVTQYAAGDYSGLLANLDGHKVVVLHKVTGDAGFDTLLSSAAAKGKGIVFLGAYPVGSFGLGMLSARKGDPSAVQQNWNQGAVKITVAQSHPILNGYAVGSTVTLVSGGDNDYQTFTGYTGTTIGTSAMPSGYPSMIAFKDAAATGGARHAILGSLGASTWTNLSHWTADGKQIFLNAVNWAKGGSPPPPPPPPAQTLLALMGDYNTQIADYLRSQGYTVDTYAAGDYTGVLANIGRYHAVILHKVTNDAGFDSLLAGAGQTGLVFLSAYPYGSYGMGVRSARQGDPGAVTQNWGDGPVTINLTAPSHPLFAGITGSQVSIISGGDNDYQTFTTFSGTIIATSAMPRGYSGAVAVKDTRSAGGNRQVVLGSLGASSWTNLTHWTAQGKRLLVNAIEWAKRP